MNSNKTYENGIYVPWYGYIMVFLLYTTPFLVMTPIGLITGFFSTQDFQLIFSSPFINSMVFIVIAAGIFMTSFESI